MTEQQTSTITPYYHKVSQRLMAEAPWVVLAVLFVIISLIMTAINLEGFFGTPTFSRIVVPNMLILMLLAPPMILIMASGSFDLSIGGTLALAAGVAAAVGNTTGMGLGLIVAVVIGLIVGLINGLLVGAARLNGLAVTFISGSILQGLVLATIGVTGRIVDRTPFVESLPRSPLIILAALLVTVLCAALAIFTPFGRRPGPNDPPESWLKHTLFVGFPYVLSGMMAGLAGVVLVSLLMFADPRIGSGLVTDVILVALLGGTALRRGTGFVISSFFAAIGLAFTNVWLQTVLVNDLVDAGLDLIVLGVWMLLALGVNTLYHIGVQRFFERRGQAAERDDQPPDEADEDTPEADADPSPA